jgi:hypothetical protein
MMEGVIPELKPEIVRADLIYNLDLPFGIDEVPDRMFTVYAYKVAEQVLLDYVKTTACYGTPEKESDCSVADVADKYGK